ncbi:oligosaccharide flippase family protein [Lutibacter sp.]|uniref:oligosaccharide flippase family protein n=1 Tax=Lutibacter sp. TaxID=1925666 RepID=UPI0025C07481|nr:oligosaccharide flippase family protein [Lutibacter sp.]MCF6168486.1 oligosaccharide flippase family protein [Lutibacter sp.]
MSQLKKGALLSYITIFLTNIIGLLLTPFIIKKLGDAEYGLYTLIGAFVGYISVLDFGLNNTIIRFVAKYKAEKDKKGEENFLAITMGIYGVISVIIVLVGIVLYFNLDTIFSNSLTLEELNKAKIMFIVLIFNLAITLPGGAFTAICSGYEHFVFPRTVNIIRYLVRSLMVVGLLLLGGDAIGLVILDTIMNILVIILNGYYVLKKLKVVFKLHYFETPLVKEIFAYSIWIFIFALVQMFQWKSGQIILGINVNTVSVAVYAIGIMLGTYYGAFASAINGVVLPRATQMVVNKESGEVLTKMMIKIGRVIILVLGFILVGFIVLGENFIFLWVGEIYKDSYLIALLIMLVSTVPLTQSFGNSILEASNKIKIKAIINLITMIIGVVIGFYVSKNHGGLGMIICIVGALFINAIITNIYFVKIFDFKIRAFFYETYAKSIFVMLFVLLVGRVLNEYIYEISWGSFLIKGIILAIIYATLGFLIALNKNEKESILNYLKKD